MLVTGVFNFSRTRPSNSHFFYMLCKMFHQEPSPTSISVNQIDEVQNSCLRYLYLKYYHNYPLLTSNSFMRPVFICMDSLHYSRTNAGQIFLYTLLNNMIDSPFLLLSINFYCPSYSSYWSRALLFLDNATTEAKTKIATFQTLYSYDSNTNRLGILMFAKKGYIS